MSNHNLVISAADTLFFRDGRPFTMGEDTYVGSINFPPNPSVLYGALYSTFKQDISVENIWLRDEGGTNYFALPKDLVVPKGTDKAKKLTLKNIDFASSAALSNNHFLVNNENKKVQDGSFLIGMINLKAYLRGKDESFSCTPLSSYLSSEIKMGIGRNNLTKITQDGMLYRIAMQRSELKIGVSIKNLESTISDRIPIQLGGEKKMAWVESSASSPDIAMPDLAGDTRFKIYLATPALFIEGFMPKILEQKGLTLLTAAIDKPIHIGGWDIAGNRPKPMLQAVPAGSVYYVQAATPQLAQEIATEIHGKSISEYYYESRYSNYTFDSKKQGFGIAFIGKI